jgi:hypothetical protein
MSLWLTIASNATSHLSFFTVTKLGVGLRQLIPETEYKPRKCCGPREEDDEESVDHIRVPEDPCRGASMTRLTRIL